MDKVQQSVKEFHQKHGLQCPEKVFFISDTNILVRTSLIAEEFAELMTALRNKDIADVVDALGDLIYVTYGTAVAMGVDMEPILKEIHRSNMSKNAGIKSGKIQKSISYRPPQIAEILNESHN